MKYAALYSPEKYSSFSFDAQIKALHKLIKALQDEIASPASREGLMQQISNLAPLTKAPLPSRLEQLIAALHPDPYRVLRALAQYFGEASLKDSQISLRTGDGSKACQPEDLQRAAGITLVLDNLRSVFNVGSIFRLAECLRIAEVLLCGITPTPLHPNMAKTALGTCEKVAWRHFDETEAAIQSLQAEGVTIYALETAEPSVSAFRCDYRLPLALVVGNESLGIAPQHLAMCDQIIHLPVLGWKNSLNVGVATSIATYQIMFGNSREV